MLILFKLRILVFSYRCFVALCNMRFMLWTITCWHFKLSSRSNDKLNSLLGLCIAFIHSYHGKNESAGRIPNLIFKLQHIIFNKGHNFLINRDSVIGMTTLHRQIPKLAARARTLDKAHVSVSNRVSVILFVCSSSSRVEITEMERILKPNAGRIASKVCRQRLRVVHFNEKNMVLMWLGNCIHGDEGFDMRRRFEVRCLFDDVDSFLLFFLCLR